MKLQIKTLNQKSLVIDIEETKTVYDLKKELSLYPDIGVVPELQKIIYAGKILVNEEKLSSYNIDVKKFLVIMILKQPLTELVQATSPSKKTEESVDVTPTTSTKEEKNENSPIIPVTPSKDKAKEELVDQIVAMGYEESDVRRALAASFYNPERAIQYLIEGIPKSPLTPEGDTSIDNDDTMSSPLTIFRNDPAFRRLRSVIQQNPSVIDEAIRAVAQTSPIFSELVNDYQEEFLSLLIEGSDEEDSDEDPIEGDVD